MCVCVCVYTVYSHTGELKKLFIFNMFGTLRMDTFFYIKQCICLPQLYFILLSSLWGFPHSSIGKESTCNAGDPSSVPGSGSSPGEGIGYPNKHVVFENSNLTHQQWYKPVTFCSTWSPPFIWARGCFSDVNRTVFSVSVSPLSTIESIFQAMVLEWIGTEWAWFKHSFLERGMCLSKMDFFLFSILKMIELSQRFFSGQSERDLVSYILM